MAGSRKTYDTGLWAEKLAALYLILKGYRILETRYKTPMGEIDIIALKNHTVVFCEVKRRKTADEALFAVHGRNRARIVNAARFYMGELARKPRFMSGGLEALDFRFDILAVSSLFRVQHLDNAWGETP